MNGLIVGGEASFSESLLKGGVSVRASTNRLHSVPVVESMSTLSDHLTRITAKNPNTKEHVSNGVSHNLDQTVFLVRDTSSAVLRNVVDALTVLNASFLEFILRLADPCDLGVRVNHTRNAVVVNLTTSVRNVLCNRDRFFLGLVRKHSSLNAVSNAVDVRLARLPSVVSFNHAALVDLNSSFLEVEALTVRVSTNGNQEHISVDFHFLVCDNVPTVKHDTILLIVDTVHDLGVHQELDALLVLQDPDVLLTDLGVQELADTFGALYDSHICAETLVNGSNLDADDTATIDNQLLGNFLLFQSAGARHYIFLVEGQVLLGG